ncbi:MAG: hypothetical protein K8R36_00710 [Planctomycetales bacterium]|nr:hypothetical protein [Planctomycetales bacterium]
MSKSEIRNPKSEGRLRFRARGSVAAFLLFIAPALLTGCGAFRNPFAARSQSVIENPLFVPAMDREFIWNQTVDAVDDYFRIEREERVRLIGGVLTEGRIDTHPTTGSTLFEPWRNDSTPGYEKLHATLQSIRRRGTVRVIPTEGGYLLDVHVLKELEDLDKPEHATAGGATLRHDGSLVRQEGAASRYSVTLGWTPIGRDMTLEQQILADLQARLNVTGQIATLPAADVLEEVKPGTRSKKVELESLPEPLRRVPGE